MYLCAKPLCHQLNKYHSQSVHIILLQHYTLIFNILLTVHLSIILVINQLNAQILVL